MKHNFGAIYKNVRLRPIEHCDIEYLRVWRNNQERNEFLRKIDEITPEMQEAWYNNYLKDVDCYAFAIDEVSELNRIVGSVSIYNLCGEQAEYGRVMIGETNARGRGIGNLSTIMCVHLAFSKLGVNNLVLSVHEDNVAAFTVYKKSGFVIVGEHPYTDGKKEWEMQVTPQHFYSLHDSWWRDIKKL